MFKFTLTQKQTLEPEEASFPNNLNRSQLTYETIRTTLLKSTLWTYYVNYWFEKMLQIIVLSQTYN